MDKIQNINFDVYNTLNLMDPVLGECYISEGYNPFNEDYRIKKDIIEQILKNANMEDPTETADFLNYDNKTVQKHFETSKKNSALLQSMLEEDKDKTDDPKTKGKINDGIIYLKNRQKMLEVFCKDLKNPNVNSIELFKKLAKLNKKYARLLEESYFEEAKMQAIHQNFITLCLAVDNTKQREEGILASMDKAKTAYKQILKQKDMEKLVQKQNEVKKEQETKQEIKKEPEPIKTNPEPIKETQVQEPSAFDRFVGETISPVTTNDGPEMEN